MPNRLRLVVLRMELQAVDDVEFLDGQAGNTLRGALGLILLREWPRLHQRVFAPQRPDGPSGLADPPRPFVLRPQLGVASIRAGERFRVDLNLFDMEPALPEALLAAFGSLAAQGLGHRRGRLVLSESAVTHLDLGLDDPPGQPVERIVVQFLTPTELKHEGKVVREPRFPIFAARLRDRISALTSLPGQHALAVDFQRFLEPAARVRLTDQDLAWRRADRRSSRTGQRHPLDGFTGRAEYAGEGLSAYAAWLRAGCYTGVGRQTVWGKGRYEVAGLPLV